MAVFSHHEHVNHIRVLIEEKKIDEAKDAAKGLDLRVFIDNGRRNVLELNRLLEEFPTVVHDGYKSLDAANIRLAKRKFQRADDILQRVKILAAAIKSDTKKIKEG